MTNRSPIPAISEVTITSPVYRTHAWWAPVTVGAVTVVSAVQTAIESIVFAYHPLGRTDVTLYLWLAHAIAGAVCAIVAGLVSAMRANTVRRPFLAYSERFLVGLVIGIVTSLAISIAFASLVADSFGQAVEYGGTLMTVSLESLELPIACVIGGLTWHLLSKTRGGAPIPARPRREIEDAQ